MARLERRDVLIAGGHALVGLVLREPIQWLRHSLREESGESASASNVRFFVSGTGEQGGLLAVDTTSQSVYMVAGQPELKDDPTGKPALFIEGASTQTLTGEVMDGSINPSFPIVEDRQRPDGPRGRGETSLIIPKIAITPEALYKGDVNSPNYEAEIKQIEDRMDQLQKDLLIPGKLTDVSKHPQGLKLDLVNHTAIGKANILMSETDGEPARVAVSFWAEALDLASNKIWYVRLGGMDLTEWTSAQLAEKPTMDVSNGVIKVSGLAAAPRAINAPPRTPTPRPETNTIDPFIINPNPKGTELVNGSFEVEGTGTADKVTVAVAGSLAPDLSAEPTLTKLVLPDKDHAKMIEIALYEAWKAKGPESLKELRRTATLEDYLKLLAKAQASNEEADWRMVQIEHIFIKSGPNAKPTEVTLWPTFDNRDVPADVFRVEKLSFLLVNSNRFPGLIPTNDSNGQRYIVTVSGNEVTLIAGVTSWKTDNLQYAVRMMLGNAIQFLTKYPGHQVNMDFRVLPTLEKALQKLQVN